MKITLTVFLAGLIIISGTSFIAGASPVLESLGGHQDVEMIKNEQVIPQYVGSYLILMNGSLVVVKQYRGSYSGGNIEIETVDSCFQAVWMGNAWIEATTTGYDTVDPTIRHVVNFDGASYSIISPVQQSPSTYTQQSQLITGTGERDVVVEGWIQNPNTHQQSNHMYISVHVVF